MDLNDMSWEGIDWIGLAQGRNKRQAVENTVMNLWVP